MVSRRRLVAFVFVISSVVLLAVFDSLLRSLSFFCCPHFLEASRRFCWPSRKLLSILLAVFSLLLSAISEAFRRPSWKLFVVFVGRLSWKLLAVFVGRLGSFSLPFLLFCSRPFSCCLSQQLLLFSCFLAVLLAVLVAYSSRSFLAKTFSGFPFLIGALINIQSSASSKCTIKRYIYSTLLVRSKYGQSTVEVRPNYSWYGNFFMSPSVHVHCT